MNRNTIGSVGHEPRNSPRPADAWMPGALPPDDARRLSHWPRLASTWTNLGIIFGNGFKVAVYGCAVAIQKFAEELAVDTALRALLRRLSGMRLVCHCFLSQACHADVTTQLYRALFLSAFDRDASGGPPPTSSVFNHHLATLPQVPGVEDDSTADEGAARRRSGRGKQIGSRCSFWESCHGQTLASPGCQPVNKRRSWTGVAGRHMDFTRSCGTLSLLAPRRMPVIHRQYRRTDAGRLCDTRCTQAISPS